MISLDVLIVNVALPSAQRSLGSGTALARGELPGREVTSPAAGPENLQLAWRGNGQPS